MGVRRCVTYFSVVIVASVGLGAPPIPVSLGDVNTFCPQPRISAAEVVGDHVVFYTAQSQQPVSDRGTLWSSDGTAEGTVVLATFSGQSYGLTKIDATHVRLDTLYEEWNAPYYYYIRHRIITDGTVSGTTTSTIFDDEFPNDVSCATTAGAGSSESSTQTVDGPKHTAFKEDKAFPVYSTGIRDGYPALLRQDSFDGPEVKVWSSPLTLGIEVVAIASTRGGTVVVADWLDDDAQVSSRGLLRVLPDEHRTEVLASSSNCSSLTGFTPFNEDLVFTSKCNSGIAPGLWRTDGSIDGTEQIFAYLEESGTTEAPAIGNVINAQGRLYFIFGTELWCSDGSPATTRWVANLSFSARGYSSIKFIGTANGILYASATEKSTSNTWLWRSDGTAEGTFLLVDRYYASNIANDSNKYLLFTRRPMNSGTELWYSDGTLEGTLPVPGFPASITTYSSGFVSQTPGYGLAYVNTGSVAWLKVSANDLSFVNALPLGAVVAPKYCMNFDSSRIDFLGQDSVHGTEVWVTDGTIEGTTLAAELAEGPAGTRLVACMSLGNSFFLAHDPDPSSSSNPLETWYFGTSGLPPTRTLLPVSPSAQWGAYVLGSGDVQDKGVELVFTDGSKEGTGYVDLQAGAASSGPTVYPALGRADASIVHADLEFIGRELQYIPPPPSIRGIYAIPAPPQSDAYAFRVSFTEAVSGVDLSDFRVITVGQVLSGTPTLADLSESEYEVRIPVDIHGEGRLGLALRWNNNITGSRGERILGARPLPNKVSLGSSKYAYVYPAANLDYMSGEYHYFYNSRDSVEGEIDGIQSADLDRNYNISLSEVLRIVQLYNSFGYHCVQQGEESEDGFLPGSSTAHACAPHDSDYNQQNWVISLTELLRVIQFYNSLGYRFCPEAGTEDGFCPGL